MLKKWYDILSKKSGCKMLADTVKQALELCEALEFYAKEVCIKVLDGKSVEEREGLMRNYRKELLKKILSEKIPENCKLNKEVFAKLKKHTVNYFSYLGGFDFKDEEKNQESEKNNSSKDSNQLKDEVNLSNKLKNSECEDVCLDEKDSKMMQEFAKYTFEPVKLDTSDEYVKKVIDKVYGEGSNLYNPLNSLRKVDLEKIGKGHGSSYDDDYDDSYLDYFHHTIMNLESLDAITFSKGDSTVLIDNREAKKKVSKILFHRNSDSTIFVKYFYNDECFVLPLRVVIKGIRDASGEYEKRFFANCLRYLDPLELVRLVFELGSPYMEDSLGINKECCNLLGTLKRMYDIFSKKSGCEMLTDAAEHAIALYRALES